MNLLPHENQRRIGSWGDQLIGFHIVAKLYTKNPSFKVMWVLMDFKSTYNRIFLTEFTKNIFFNNLLTQMRVRGQESLRTKCQNARTDTNKNLEHYEDIFGR